jgi:hypothetical protein
VEHFWAGLESRATPAIERRQVSTAIAGEDRESLSRFWHACSVVRTPVSMQEHHRSCECRRAILDVGGECME